VRVAFIGCRDWTDYEVVKKWVRRYAVCARNGFTVVTGCARGADACARKAAEELGLDCKTHVADWKGLGRAAGPERNRRIVADADACVAFWDGRSPGTLNCIQQFVCAGKKVRIVPKEAP